MTEENARNLFQKYSIVLSDEQYEKFSVYAEMLKQERSRQNVTAIDRAEEVWVRHFLDSAYLAAHIPYESKMIDIGTGGGIPGIPLAILRNDLKITLLDSELNKIRFCEDVCNHLALDITAISARAEEIAHDPQYRAQFDCAVSRAMAAGNILTELAVPFLKKGGKMIAMKGRSYSAEQERFHNAAELIGAEKPAEIQYELEGETKHLIVIEKLQDTPTIYPRRFAKIKRSPL